MGRNLLPRLRQAPNPANIPQAKIGEWTPISVPADLAKLDFGIQKDDDVRTRIQSIPSPWARLLLFRTALEDSQHPARPLVTNELLDALQFLWSASERPSSPLTFRTIRVADLVAHAQHVASERVEWLAHALTELLPRRDGAGHAPAFEQITLVLLGGKPVMATSPFTLLFTAEDAASMPEASTGSFFRYSVGGEVRTLADRPLPFQRYIAQVLLPQLDSQENLRHASTDAGAVQRLVKKWLQDEIAACRRRLAGNQQAQLEPPGEGDWQAAAATLGLVPESRLTGAVQLFVRREGAQMSESRWLLQPTRAGAPQPPLVLEPTEFDGRYYPGAPAVTLPVSLTALDRGMLPGTATHYPWVNPAQDWFADKILILSEPLERESVHGLAHYSSNHPAPPHGLGTPQITLPVRRELFRWFTPADLDERLSIDVHPTGHIEVTLRVPMAGGKEMLVRRRYDQTMIYHGATGPALTLWPRFRSDRWRDYTLFRRDENAQVAQHIKVEASVSGETLAEHGERRNNVASVTSFDAPPEVLEFSNVIAGGGKPERLGVVLPRLQPARQPAAQQWHVGIDFGTSNTVISVRKAGGNAPEIFRVADLTLPLTKATDETRTLLDAYFLPHELRPEPFGTAAVHFHQLPTLNLDQDRLAVRVNIPFNGNVQEDAQNRVAGDLKWSTDQQQHFLTQSFLRHLLAVVLAQAISEGVEPANVEIVWAYPRAFSPSQANQLRAMWQRIRDHFAMRLGGMGSVRESLDESQAVLQFFFNQASVATVGSVNVIVDVGGGTSDIAMYGHGETLVLDSVMLGGRSLTGKREFAGHAGAHRNPFVQRFVAWAMQHQLADYPAEARAVTKYLQDGEDHLAFGYLLRSRWFRAHGQPFSGSDAYHDFQTLVLYFFGSLFYYVGLSLRGVAGERATGPLVPTTLMLAGNGSQYVRWLTDLTSAPLGPFERAFGRLLLDGMGVAESATVPMISLTPQPKLEVALGLVAAVTPGGVGNDRTERQSLVGENVIAAFGSGAAEVELAVTSRMSPSDLLQASSVARLRWADGEREIERFHGSFERSLREVVGHGGHWNKNAQRTQAFFAELRREQLEQATRAQLQLIASKTEGFHGSLFMLEASTVLGLMLDRFFPAGQLPPRPNTTNAARQA